MPIDMRPIGVVRSTLRDQRDAPRQAFEGAPEATLEIDPRFAAALYRVTPGTELIVVTWLHEADRTILQVRPMDDELVPLTGVFATRSPDRPNPVGLHRVTVIGCDPPTSLRVDAARGDRWHADPGSENCDEGSVRRLESARPGHSRAAAGVHLGDAGACVVGESSNSVAEWRQVTPQLALRSRERRRGSGREEKQRRPRGPRRRGCQPFSTGCVASAHAEEAFGFARRSGTAIAAGGLFRREDRGRAG